jgi:uncharacterized membrane protein
MRAAAVLNAIKNILQGRWLGHPLHPALVHLPTGLWPAALLFDVLSRAGVGGHAMVLVSFACIAGGLLAVLAAVPTGIADWSDVKRERPAWRIGLYHMILNVVATGTFGLNLWLRWDDVGRADVVSTGELLLSLLGVCVLAVSGYLGGRLAYEHGIGVARMSKGKWRRVAEAVHANLPPAKEA